MPVTAKLSQKFYERLGEEVANELVDWFNSVDATYRDDLRALNELNYQRFEAKLEQRVAEVRFAVARLEDRFGQLEERLDQRLDSKLAGLRAELIKWMFVFWLSALIPIVGLFAIR